MVAVVVKVVVLQLCSTLGDVAALRYLQLSLNESVVRSSETPLILTMISYNPAGRVLTWRYVRSHWKELYDR